MLEEIKRVLNVETNSVSSSTTIPIVHNFTMDAVRWGHNLWSDPLPGSDGKTHTMVGYSVTPMLVGDYILISVDLTDYDFKWNARYVITEIAFGKDLRDSPRDRFTGQMEFVDRTQEQKYRDLDMIRKKRIHWVDTETV